MNGLVRATDNRLHATNVGLPSAVGASMRVGNFAAEADAFSTNIAFCHGFSTSCVVLLKRNEWILPQENQNCKSILKKIYLCNSFTFGATSSSKLVSGVATSS